MKLSNSIKQQIINQNISESKLGMYSQINKYEPIKLYFNDKQNVPPINNICSVEVINKHNLEVLEDISKQGEVNPNVVIINVVGKDFTATNFELCPDIRDELINLRTTFNTTIHGTEIDDTNFPLQNNECVYTKLVSLIRPKTLERLYSYNELISFAMITSSPIIPIQETMTRIEFLQTCSTIECIFQTAISASHKIIILPPFGYYDKNLPNYIIKIYNYCIFKYGHLFDKIIIAIPEDLPNDLFMFYQKNIINPYNLVKSIDQTQNKSLILENIKPIKQNNTFNIDNLTQEQLLYLKSIINNIQ